MKYIKELNNAEVVESTQENQDEIKEAIDIIFSYGNRERIIYVAINDFSNRAFICLYKEPLEKMGEQALCLKQNLDLEWRPKDSIIDLQLARLNHDFQDFQ